MLDFPDNFLQIPQLIPELEENSNFPAFCMISHHPLENIWNMEFK